MRSQQHIEQRAILESVNLLAHAYLAGEDEAALAGQFVADYLTPGWKQSLPPAILREIRCHQRIDAFTDTHPVARRTAVLFPDPFVLYRGILVDMFYGHCLAANWEHYSDVPLEDFAASTYRALSNQRKHLGKHLKRVLPKMTAGDWLTAYRTRAGIIRALAGLSKRLKRDNPLAEAGPLLDNNYDAITADFHEFFPLLIAEIKHWRTENP